jgi:hypothetical protein
LQEKTPRRLERCSVDEVVASFHGLQVSSVPFQPSGFCHVVSASETNSRSLAVFQAAAEAAKKKRVSGQYATTEIGQAASELQKGQRTMWDPCVKVEGTRGPRKSSSRRLFVLFGQLKLL